MPHLRFRNVNGAFSHLVELFHKRGKDQEGPKCDWANIIETNSRNGPVLQIVEPMTITYEKPKERVLFNEARDCNPFMHLYESLWMLAGRNDVEPLAYYTPRFREFSDDGRTFNGAYGYRWRHGYNGPMWAEGRGKELANVDQLKILIDHLIRLPESRRAVLQMWNVEDDLLRVGSDLDFMQGKISKDVCCNLSVMFSLRDTGKEGPLEYHQDTGEYHEIDPLNNKFLDMTVTNRSNDMIWGMLGANVVHFSILQEYMAAHLGVEVGVYNQFTNNLHVYTERFEPEKWVADTSIGYCPRNEYGRTIIKHFPLVSDPVKFDEELPKIVEMNKDGEEVTAYQRWVEPFFDLVAQKMFHAFHLYKQRDFEAALGWCKEVAADDWRIAATNWIKRRMK